MAAGDEWTVAAGLVCMEFDMHYWIGLELLSCGCL